MDLTAAQANALLEGIETEDDLRNLVERLDVTAEGKVTVLYSGKVNSGVHSVDVVQAMLSAGDDVRVIDKTEAAAFLDIFSEGKTNHEFIRAAKRIFDDDPAVYGSRANQFLFGAVDEQGKRISTGAWDIVSARFVEATTGEVRALVNRAEPDRVFGMTELPRALANPNITQVEGIARTELAAVQASQGGHIAFEIVAARAHENIGKLAVAVDADGQPQKSGKSLRVDARAYFAIVDDVALPSPQGGANMRPLAEALESPTPHALAGGEHLQRMQAVAPSRTGSDMPAASRLDDIPDDLKPHLSKLKIHPDGLPDDGVPFYPADEKHLKTYTDASEALSRFKAPRLLESDKPHQRLFVAAFDGTGNDVNQDPLHATNVAKIEQQLRDLGSGQISVEYLNGPGTQRQFFPRSLDGGLGYTYEDRIEEMYSRFAKQVQTWKNLDPEADVRVLSLGFSRGGSQVAGFARLVDERGVVDPRSRIEVPDENGNMVERYTRYLIAPGEIPQVIAPFDPVATGVPMHFDRRPPPSVVSGFGIFAMDEPRHKFKGDMIMPLGLSEDGRFLNVPVAGCHSNIGGCYTRDGLSNRSMNLMVDYINALSDKPLLSKVYEPDDPRQTVIHRSDKHMLIYKIDLNVDRMTPAGQVHSLKPQPLLGLFAPDVRDANAPMSHRASEKVSFYDAKIILAPPPPAVNPTVRIAEQAAALQAAETPKRVPLSPQAKAMGAVGVFGAVTSIVDAKQSADRIATLLDRDNATGAKSELIHFTARSVGGWGGAVMGAGVGAAVSSPTGPGAIIGGIVGGAIGVVGGDAVAKVLDHRAIYRQEDSQGMVWTFDSEKPSQGWHRKETVEELAASGRSIETQKNLVAVGELESELTRKASTKALELMLATPPVPSDPYALSADAGDAFSSKPSPWRRDPASGTWTRDVYERQYTGAEGDRHVLKDTMIAPADRAAELEALSQRTLRENVHLTPAAMAARFELSSHDSGWTRHHALPASAANALGDDGRLIGSDGAEYRRQHDGRWERSAMFGFSTADATATMQLELDTTRSLLREGLVAHRAQLAERSQPAAQTLEASMTSMAASEYANHGLTRSPEALSEMGRALAADYRARDLSGPWMMQLQRDPSTNAYGPDSPLGIYMRGADGDMELRFTMTPVEAKDVLATQPSSQVAEASRPTSPERVILQSTPEQRDAAEQAQREANRQGLSQGDVQREVTLATIEVRGKRASPSSAQHSSADESTDAPTTSPEVVASAASLPTPPPPPSEIDNEAHKRDPQPQHGEPPSTEWTRQDDATHKTSAASPEEQRARDTTEPPAEARDHRASPEAPLEAEESRLSVSERHAQRETPAEVPPFSPVPTEQHPVTGARVSAGDAGEYVRPQVRAPEIESVDRTTPTPLSRDDTANDRVAAVTDPAPPVQAREAPPLYDAPDALHSARFERENPPGLGATTARSLSAGEGRRLPGDATEDRDDLDRQHPPRADIQASPEPAPVPPVVALDQEDEEARKDRQRRGPDASETSPTADRAMSPETATRPFDLRHPDHPEHAMYLSTREKVADLYERHSTPMPEDKLERATAAVLSDARAERMTHIAAVQLTATEKYGDVPDLNGKIIAWSHDPADKVPWSKASYTDTQTLDNRDPDRDYARFREATMQEQQSFAEFQKQQEAINQNPTGPTMTMGARTLSPAMADDGPSGSDGGGGDGGGGG